MPLNAHLAQLERKHRALESKLAEILNHPSSDDTAIQELKRQKLQLKDEIERLKKETTVH